MAPPRSATVNGDRKFQALIDFAKDLQEKLPSAGSDGGVELLIADLGQHSQAAERFAHSNSLLSKSAAKMLERQARNLWNCSVRLKREGFDDVSGTNFTRLLVRSRVFAMQALELSRRTDRQQQRDDESEVAYVLNLILTLGRMCIREADLASARSVLQKAAEYVERLKELPMKNMAENGGARRKRFEAEYLTIRTALSWKEGRLDVAEHMFGKTQSLRHDIDAQSAETMADTLQHIGMDLSTKSDHQMAVKWLKRAYDLLSAQSLDNLSLHGLELRLSICQTLVQALLLEGSPGSIQEASDLVAYVSSEIGEKPVVLRWQLEILQASSKDVFDVDAYASILRAMVRSFDYSNETFHFLLHHVRKLFDSGSKLALALVDEFMNRHILKANNTEWTCFVVVLRIKMVIVHIDEADPLASLVTFLNSVCEAGAESLQPDATGAVHSLIWRKLEASMSSSDYTTAMKWCQVALHPIFSNSGEGNRSKFFRKQIMCAIGLSNGQQALAIFREMPSVAQDEPMTRYLMFKASLTSWDHELGRQSIEWISKMRNSIEVQNILYACVREAQQAGDKICTLAALRAVVKCGDAGNTICDHLPTMLRCTVRLIQMIEESDDKEKQADQSSFTEDICCVFEKAAQYARLHPRNQNDDKVFTVLELHWFRKNAYNLGVSKCHLWGLPWLVRIFNCCLVLIGCYPSGLPLQDSTDLALMAMRCHFITAAALISQARSEDSTGTMLQYYKDARSHIASFDELLQTEVGVQDDEIIGDLITKMSTLFVFDFESAVALQSWEDLNEIVRKAKMTRDEESFKAMGDCLLRGRPPGRVMFATMRLIINKIYQLEEFDNQKLAKYIRCVFQAILPLDSELSLQLLQQAVQIARDTHKAQTPLPSAEIEWLAATAFNHSVDFYVRGEEQSCHNWALKAMALAEFVGDSGVLRNLLLEKFAKLRLQTDNGGV